METKCEVEVFPLYCYRSDNNSRKSAKLKSSLVFTGLEEENRLIARTQAQKAAYPDRKAGPETRPALT